MSYYWGADAPRPEAPPPPGDVYRDRDRIPLRLWAKACCANPTPVLQTDRDNKPFVMCANCGNRT